MGEIGMGTGVCNLGSMNLVKYVNVNKEQQMVEFDFTKYKKHVYYAVRFLDNINDLSRVPLPEYKQAIIDKRRIGLGNLGLGSVLYMLGLKYGSDEAIKFTEKLYTLKTETELLASAQIGKEKGSFLLFDKDKYFNSFWWKNLKISDDVKRTIENIGAMRNSHHSMNAPTGNTSILAEQVSGGIEPVFLKEYIRWAIVPEFEKASLIANGLKIPNVHKGEWFETNMFKLENRGKDEILKGTYNGENYEIDKNRGLVKSTKVTDYGWAFVKDFYTPENLNKLEKNGVFSTTADLSVDDHINMLKVISHYTNQNNSKTVNLPNDYTYDEFKNLYYKAWTFGIKGITTYRAGTMTAVLESIDTVQDSPRTAPKRPKKLLADFYTITVQNNKYLFAIGLFNGKPYEMFGGLMENMHFNFRERRGEIIKIKRGHYKVKIGDDIEIENFAQQFTPIEQNTFRLISTSLRHDVPIKYIVEQLQKATMDLFSLTTAGARVLKKYIADGENATGTTCENCGSDKFSYIESCPTCTVCGWSKCV